MLKIIAGTRRGHHLQTPPDTSIRPMLAQVRKALMDILTPRLFRAAILDLFAGTGALSLEALSRGASHAVLVEQERSALRILRANVQKLDFAAQTLVVESDAYAPNFPRSVEWPFDIVFVDPPYANVESAGGPGRLAAALGTLAATGRFAPDARIVLHLPPGAEIDRAIPPALEVEDERAYGRTEIAILAPKRARK